MKFLTCLGAATAALCLCTANPAVAVSSATADYIYAGQELPIENEGCLAIAPGGYFIGIGAPLAFPAPGGTRTLEFVSESGVRRTVALGFNALGECVYDASGDVLYVLDNGATRAGAATGDTVFAIQSASTASAVTALGSEYLPAGSVPFGSALEFDPGSGDLFVTTALGSGLGAVLRLDSGGVAQLASGFDFAGGIVLTDDASVLVADSRCEGFGVADVCDFASSVREVGLDGSDRGEVVAPNFEHGSLGLALATDGRLIATGGNATIALVEGADSVTPLVSDFDASFGGPAFGGPLDVRADSGMIAFLGSGFAVPSTAADRSIHKLIPRDRLLDADGASSTECLHRFYGVDPATLQGSARRPLSVCRDGASCDLDGRRDGVCTFALGSCLGVADGTACVARPVATYELLRSQPSTSPLTELALRVAAGLPVEAETCVLADALALPLRQARSGRLRRANGVWKVRVRSADSSALRDVDVLRLRCLPAS